MAEYQSLLEHPGWRRLCREVENRAIFNVDKMLQQIWIPGEPAEAYALRIMEDRQFVAACKYLLQWPAIAIETILEEEQ